MKANVNKTKIVVTQTPRGYNTFWEQYIKNNIPNIKDAFKDVK